MIAEGDALQHWLVRGTRVLGGFLFNGTGIKAASNSYWTGDCFAVRHLAKGFDFDTALTISRILRKTHGWCYIIELELKLRTVDQGT